MVTLHVRSLACLVAITALAPCAWAQGQGGPAQDFPATYEFRNGSAWGMPQTGLVCLGTMDVSVRTKDWNKRPSAMEVLAVRAPMGSLVRVVRVSSGSRFVFWPDHRTNQKSATVPSAGFVQFVFGNSPTTNPNLEPWDEAGTFEIRVRFPDGTWAEPTRIARACGFQIRHSASANSLGAVAVAAYAARGGTRAPADVSGSTRVGFRLDTRPDLGGQSVSARMWITENVRFLAEARWSDADNIVVGGLGVVMSDIPLARTGVLHGFVGGGPVQRTLALLNSPGGRSQTIDLPPVWGIRESGTRTFRTNRPGGYGYMATATVRARILSNNPVGDALVSTTGKATGLSAGFVPNVPF